MWPLGWLFGWLDWLFVWLFDANQLFCWYAIGTTAYYLSHCNKGANALVDQTYRNSCVEVIGTCMLLPTWLFCVASMLAWYSASLSVLTWAWMPYVWHAGLMLCSRGIFSAQLQSVEWELAVYKHLFWWAWAPPTDDRIKYAIEFVYGDVQNKWAPLYWMLLYLYPYTEISMQSMQIAITKERNKQEPNKQKLLEFEKNWALLSQIKQKLFSLQFLLRSLVVMRLLFIGFFLVMYYRHEKAEESLQQTRMQQAIRRSRENYERLSAKYKK